MRAFHTLFTGLFLLTKLVQAAETNPTAPHKMEGAAWENISDDLFKKLEVEEMKQSFLRRCVGMTVTPDGTIFVLTSKDHGVSVSKDQGATWSTQDGAKITGRCETGFGFSIAYPYDGRLAFFTIDGTGGITLDGGAKWRPFTRVLRSFEFADIDWTMQDPQFIFGLTHEAFYTYLSNDGGRNWQHVDEKAEAALPQKTLSQYQLGFVDALTLLRSHRGQEGIELSTNAGLSWTEVAKYHVLGRRPVHYGKKTYWTATEGVIMTTNGKDWTLAGKGPENAVFGPYFGLSENEFMVVSDKAFSITHDGGKTWQEVAPAFTAPDSPMKGFSAKGSFNYFGWDPKGNTLYASGLGGSVFRLRMKL